MKLRLSRIAVFAVAYLFATASLLAKPPKSDGVLLIVMDPLSRELACACVKGYGQRDYRKLAAHLESTIKQRVTIEFSDDLVETLKSVPPARDVLIIGDNSLVAANTKKASFTAHPLCELSDTDGDTGQTASIIVRSDDPARELKDIHDRKLFFGLQAADAKYNASLAALREAGVELPKDPEKHRSYSDAALDLLDSNLTPPPVAIIPTYALRMLEGCGSVKPGNFRVIGKSKPTRFITLFVSDATPADKQQKILKTLLALKSDRELLNALESRDGFKAIQTEQGSAKPSANSAWPDWRGPNRDGRVPKLPARLPAHAKVIWKKGAVEGGLAGLSVSDNRAISAERDLTDENDVYRCFNAETGEPIWRINFPAPGNLDFGNAPRATPVIHRDRVYLLSALGELRCVNLANGNVIWKRHLPRAFKAELPTWGMCSPPLIVNDLLIVNPGATNASIVALDAATGRTRWTTPGRPAAYSAFISTSINGVSQIVGYDKTSLGGWNPKTGKRLWQVTPPVEGDFNVPTPIAYAEGILVATENNGARFYSCASSEKISCRPSATFADLKPDTTTPVLTNKRLFGATHQTLYCLDVDGGLKPIWQHSEDSLGDHSTFIADDERVLVISLAGELILLDAKSDNYSVLSRMRLFDDNVELYAHPALVGSRLFARAGSSLICVDLESESL